MPAERNIANVSACSKSLRIGAIPQFRFLCGSNVYRYLNEESIVFADTTAFQAVVTPTLPAPVRCVY